MRTDRSQFDYKRKRDESIAVGLKPIRKIEYKTCLIKAKKNPENHFK